MQRGIFVFAVLSVLGGCADYVIKTPFNEADFVPWAGGGPANIHGSAQLETRYGQVRTCAGQAVLLAPANAYDEEVYPAGGAVLPSPANLNPAVVKYLRRTMCDREGRFTFLGLPAREWILILRIGGSEETEWRESVNLKPGDNRAGVNAVEVTACDKDCP